MTFEAQSDSHSYHIYLCCCEINNYKHPYAQGKKLRLLSATFACLSPPHDAGDLLGRSGRKAGVGCLPALHQSKRSSRGRAGRERRRKAPAGSRPAGPAWTLWNSLRATLKHLHLLFQFECGNGLSRTSAKPASSPLEGTFFSLHLCAANDCSVLLALHCLWTPRRNMGPLVTASVKAAWEHLG